MMTPRLNRNGYAASRHALLLAALAGSAPGWAAAAIGSGAEPSSRLTTATATPGSADATAGLPRRHADPASCHVLLMRGRRSRLRAALRSHRDLLRRRDPALLRRGDGPE